MASTTEANSVANLIPSLKYPVAQSTGPPTPPISPAVLSTNTSAVAPQSQVRQRRAVKSAGQKWQPLDLGNIRCCITSAYGQTLTQESLVSIALVLLRMEHEIVSTIAQQRRFSLSIRTDNETKFRTEQELQNLLAIKSQIEQIQQGKAKIHADYLMDEYLLAYWDEAFHILRLSMLWDPKDEVNYQTVIARLKKLEWQGAELAKYLFIASVDGNLSLDIRSAIHQKWAKFDEMIDSYHRETGTDRECVGWPLASRSVSGPNHLGKSVSESTKQVVKILWGTLIGSAVLSAIFMGTGFFYSSSEPGHWRDPDFWFLLQSSTVQLCGLLTTGLSFDRASTKDWLSGSAAAGFAIMAPVLYVKAPTQYSMWSSGASGVFQALLILQRSVCDLGDEA